MQQKNIFRRTKERVRLVVISGSMFVVTITGCKKYLDIPLPSDKITADAAFSNDRTTAAVLNNILLNLDFQRIVTGTGIGFETGLYSDELQDIAPPPSSASGIPFNTPFYTNTLTADINTDWSHLYQEIYNVNSAIEGIKASTGILRFKNQWLGESYYLRALLYFYTVNLYGDIVLTTTSDYTVNRNLPRVDKAQVYQQMVSDLITAEGLLSRDYRDGSGNTTTSRARPNHYAAFALLARVYLYMGDWANAKIQADTVINGVISGATKYSIVPSANIGNAFLANSPETIFGITTAGPFPTGTEWGTYNAGQPAVLPDYPAVQPYTTSALSESLVKAFDTADLRKKNWIRSSLRPGGPDPSKTVTWYAPDKYKSQAAGTDLFVVSRLAEQYLIRSEANAKLGDLPSAINDLNVTRTRAGLTALTTVAQNDMVDSIMNERRRELFVEVGHRFFDLRRTGKLDAVMNAEVANKAGATWSTYKQYWPIPLSDIQQNSFLVQTPGY